MSTETNGGDEPFPHLDDALRSAREALEQQQPTEPSITPRRGVGLLLRRLACVDENVLAQVPSERPRYTRLGGVVLGTATIAAFSMLLALGEVLDGLTPELVILAVGWGAFIAVIDGLLIASMQGTRWRNHLWVVLPRLVLAIFLGIVIAEPLVLRIFDTAIVREIEGDRQAEVLAFQTKFTRCNPLTGEQPPKALVEAGKCDDARVNVTLATPAALQAQLVQATERRRIIQRDVKDIHHEQARLNTIARRECNGTSGDGLTGDFGVGPNCLRNRADADQFEERSELSKKTKQVVALNQTIANIERDLRTRTDEYAAAVTAAIKAAVDEKRRQDREIGLLERIEALASLSEKHWHVGIAAIFVRIIFVAIGCLPILIKLMGGTTAYDRLFEERLASRERSFRQRERTKEAFEVARLAVAQSEIEREVQAAREQLDRELRVRGARQEVGLDEEIDELTEKKVRERQRARGVR